uniref:AB hydrolase-1 domain-containing protein n=1 Tax=Macrostomum lignano TaxID=282301 RepID=A0A1I8H3T3_9PLAT
MSKIWDFISGPRLYRYLDSSSQSQPYEANIFEAIPDYIFGTTRFCIGLAQWGWPMALPYMLKQALYSSADQLSLRCQSALSYSIGAVCLLLCAACCRTLGRSLNPTYSAFTQSLRKARRGFTAEDKESLSKYDFDFWAWPVEFKATQTQPLQPASGPAEPVPHPLDWLLGPASRLLVQTIGIRMTYPGCTALMNAVVRPMLQQTRARLQGLPFPETEREFIETVLQFAQQRLGFEPGDTALLAWSIGGYSATWAAARQPQLRYLLLDATFDNIEELAVKAMPKFASWFVRYPGPVKIIRRTQDEMITTGRPGELVTNRGNQLLLALLRRRYPNLLPAPGAAGGASDGLIVLNCFLARGQKAQLTEYLASVGYIGDEACLRHLANSRRRRLRQIGNQNPGRQIYPLDIGVGLGQADRVSVLLFLAGKLMVNMESTHCTPLTPGLFTPPWSELTEPALCDEAELQQFKIDDGQLLISDPSVGPSSESDASWEPV